MQKVNVYKLKHSVLDNSNTYSFYKELEINEDNIETLDKLDTIDGITYYRCVMTSGKSYIIRK